MKTMETERLRLRPFRPDDLGDFHAYAKSPQVGPGAGWKPHSSVEETRKFLQQFMDGDEVWAIALKDSDRVIGSIGLHPDTRRENPESRMMGYVLSPDHWGKGYATEAAQRLIRFAFEEAKVDILGIYHYPQNTRSRRVIEKCGFAYEGSLRRGKQIYDGSVFDVWCYSLLKEEYKAGCTD